MSKEDLKFGPSLPISEEIHAQKYRGKGETYSESCARFAHTLSDSPEHFRKLYRVLLDMRFMGGGRTQASVGSPRTVTAFNCFVSGTIEDSMDDIMDKAHEAAETMRLGGGIGYDFSTLRPRGDNIVSLDSRSSGPISFMEIYDAVCHTISSAGHRRGAQMGVLRVDHPDIEEFIRAKQNQDTLTQFNVSIGVTDDFMEALMDEREFELTFGGKVYNTISAKYLWEEIMRSTWEWAEPGVLFIDTINRMNNLHYCETIAATNPCAEQPLPPYGACLLGSFNLVKYIEEVEGERTFNIEQLATDIPAIVRAMDNIHDTTTFPLDAQAVESQQKRRMGLGVTGVANTGEALGLPYASTEFLKWLEAVLTVIRDGVYNASIDLAKEKGPFPLFDAEEYCKGEFIKTLPQSIRRRIKKYGIRNSHLLSIAPTGTISLAADNISSGIEPVYATSIVRTVQGFDGPTQVELEDYAYRVYGIEGKTAEQCSAHNHLKVLEIATKYVDSAVSKTINVNPDMPWDEFKSIYTEAWKAGCKGVTTFNPSGKRFGILNEKPKAEKESTACFIDPASGTKECS